MQAIGEDLDWLKPRRDVLIFPVKAEDRQPVKRVGLAVVCPTYSGVPEPPTCEVCRFCFTAGAAPQAAPRNAGAGG
jgi:hypothetical protein